ncbi:MAG TPA: YIP1 family protein [Candidatus Krumholzibacteria bacterium]|nr:YIP1 family protein [Candidatus Krumholzibacteria bacterium]HPD71139.1 YIP1 family protein [Candidatus Krumholzibacteria bacterium]HRY39161.1 YIP1 family protein [Candidatus Krumholzibacteria bacterium]
MSLASLDPPPWERRREYGTLNALVVTIRLVLFSPDRLFSRMPVGLGLLQPLLFAVVVALVGALFDWMWALATGNLPSVLAPGLARAIRGPYFTAAHFLLSPAVAVVVVFVRAAVFHGVLVVLGCNRLGFEATFRVVAYCRATRLLSILPFCGGIAGLVWELVATVIGLARIHDCATGKAVLAVVLPVVVIAVSLGGWILTLLGMAALR